MAGWAGRESSMAGTMAGRRRLGQNRLNAQEVSQSSKNTRESSDEWRDSQSRLKPHPDRQAHTSTESQRLTGNLQETPQRGKTKEHMGIRRRALRSGTAQSSLEVLIHPLCLTTGLGLETGREACHSTQSLGERPPNRKCELGAPRIGASSPRRWLPPHDERMVSRMKLASSETNWEERPSGLMFLVPGW